MATSTRQGQVWEQTDVPRAASGRPLANLCNMAPSLREPRFVVRALFSSLMRRARGVRGGLRNPPDTIPTSMNAPKRSAMPARLKILHVAETAKGGVGSYIDDVASLQISKHGAATVRVIVPDAHASQLQRVPTTAQCSFKAAGGRMVNTLRMARLALAQVHDWQPDVVHLHSTFAGFALRPLLALRSGRTKVVYCSHGWAFDREGPAAVNRAFQWVERIWARWCDVVVCVSEHELRAAEQIGIDRRRLALVNNGIRDTGTTSDADGARASWPAGVRRVLFVGRMDRQKGVDVLFDTMRRLQDKAFAVVVGASVVAGKGPSKVPQNVRIVGWLRRDEIAAYYSAADVVVISSRWEAFSLVAVEAMRAGRTVVATEVGGLRDVIVDGVTGHLVGQGDAGALAEAVARLDNDSLTRMGRAARERYERHFGIDRVVDELDVIYRDILAAERHRAEFPIHAPRPRV
jgi:glycosyltransferase involved in cell wall biosynthesis